MRSGALIYMFGRLRYVNSFVLKKKDEMIVTGWLHVVWRANTCGSLFIMNSGILEGITQCYYRLTDGSLPQLTQARRRAYRLARKLGLLDCCRRYRRNVAHS